MRFNDPSLKPRTEAFLGLLLRKEKPMPIQDREDQRLKAEIDEIMQRVNRILDKIKAEDPANKPEGDGGGQ